MAVTASRRRGRPKSVNLSSYTGIQALDRGLDVLEGLASHEGVTLTELSVHLGQSAATMYRVLATLEQRRYVEASPEGQWFVGPEAFKLGSAFLRRTDIVERSRSVMRDLMVKTGETSNLGIEREGHVLFVSQVESRETIRAYFPPGARSPLHASGIGKVLLSAFDEKRLEGFSKAATFVRFTDKTITSAGRLREELQAIRQRGYAVDDEERAIGMRCVAACILNRYSEAVAGISVSGPTARMPDMRLREIGVLVTDAARDISRRLGAD